MKEKYISAVAEHNLQKVRMMLVDELFLDPRGGTFSEMLKYAKEQLVDLFEPNESSNYEIPADRQFWDINLASKVKQDLISNFSIEKLALFQEIAMETGKEKAKVLDEDERKSQEKAYRFNPSGKSTTANNDKVDFSDNKLLGEIMLCGGAVLVIIGCWVDGCYKTVLTIVGGLGVMVGGILLYSVKKGNK